MIDYDDIDEEIRELVRVLNSFDGIETTCSCCGHGKSPCYIWMKIDSVKTLNDFCFNFLNPFYGWEIVIENNIVKNQPHIFCRLSSATKGYKKMCFQTKELVKKIREVLDDNK